jgi:hypothetical protein
MHAFGQSVIFGGGIIMLDNGYERMGGPRAKFGEHVRAEIAKRAPVVKSGGNAGGLMADNRISPTCCAAVRMPAGRREPARRQRNAWAGR